MAVKREGRSICFSLHDAISEVVNLTVRMLVLVLQLSTLSQRPLLDGLEVLTTASVKM